MWRRISFARTFATQLRRTSTHAHRLRAYAGVRGSPGFIQPVANQLTDICRASAGGSHLLGGRQAKQRDGRHSHYEEELQRRICSLPALLATRTPPASAKFPMFTRHSLAQVMPCISPTPGSAHAWSADRMHRAPAF